MKCQNCKTDNSDTAKYCKKCSIELAETYKCIECGHMNPQDSKYCEDCGKSLKKKRRLGNGLRIILICIPVAAIIFTFCFYFWWSMRPLNDVSGDAEKFPIAFFMIIVTIVGALINQGFRSRENKDNVRSISSWWFVGFVVWKCLVALSFTFLLYFMFIGSLVTGDLFPKFINVTADDGGKYETMMKFATVVEPASYMDVAKLLVWCFIAGYSERFVSNLVTNILNPSLTGGNAPTAGGDSAGGQSPTANIPSSGS